MYLRAHLLYLHFLAVSVQTDQGREMQSSTACSAVTPLLLFILRIDQLIEGGGKKVWSDIRLSC